MSPIFVGSSYLTVGRDEGDDLESARKGKIESGGSSVEGVIESEVNYVGVEDDGLLLKYTGYRPRGCFLAKRNFEISNSESTFTHHR